MTDAEREYESNWHLDKKVPIALIVTIMVQTAGGIWWAATVNARVNTLEAAVVQTAPQADRLTRVEVKIENVERGVNRIESVLQSRTPAGFQAVPR